MGGVGGGRLNGRNIQEYSTAIYEPVFEEDEGAQPNVTKMRAGCGEMNYH